MAAKEPGEAKNYFLQAVAADSLYGPAQNNLGIVLLNEGDYFGAATCFDKAIKLLPQDPEPRTNLGLVYEGAGQLRNAQNQLEQTLLVAPEHLPAIQALARVRVRIGVLDEKALTLLRTVAQRGTDPKWRDWARQQLLKHGVTGD